MVSGLWMWAVSDIKLVTSVECGVGYCMRFALIFVKIWEIVSCVEIPDLHIFFQNLRNNEKKRNYKVISRLKQ